MTTLCPTGAGLASDYISAPEDDNPVARRPGCATIESSVERLESRLAVDFETAEWARVAPDRVLAIT